jgi:MoxR-like ATPase
MDKSSGEIGDMTVVKEVACALMDNMRKVFVGKEETVEMLLVALLCEGHVLIEDVPGTGKTVLAKAAAKSLGMQFQRIQCTPDLLPSDVIGIITLTSARRSSSLGPAPSSPTWYSPMR